MRKSWSRRTPLWYSSNVCGAILATIIVVGCSEGSATPEVTREDPQKFETLIEQAIAGGASAQQLDVLETALEEGSLSYATLESLIEPLFECFESAGIEGTLVEPMEALPGVFVPDIRMTDTMGRDPEHAMRVSHECEEKHWGYAMTYYLDQPSSVAAFDDELIREREPIRSCLADRGIALDPNASVHEIKVALYEDIVQGVDVAGWAPCYTSSDLLILDID